MVGAWMFWVFPAVLAAVAASAAPVSGSEVAVLIKLGEPTLALTTGRPSACRHQEPPIPIDTESKEARK